MCIRDRNRTDSIIRAFYEPPRFKLFSVIEGMRPEDTCATKMRDYGFTEVLEQCRHLFSMITKKYFTLSNMKMDGMIFDFIQHQSGISFFQNISGYHSRSSGIASVSSTKTSGFQTRKMSSHCAGFICKEKNLFVTKLIQAIKQVMKVPNPPSLLYHIIETYQNDFKYYAQYHRVEEFGIGFPFVGEKIVHNHFVRKQGEVSSGPALFDVVPVCEDCFYMYSLYSGKKEKQRTPKPMLENIFGYLRRLGPEAWDDVEFEILVSACDPRKESYEMLKYKHVLPRSAMYISKQHNSLNGSKPRRLYTGSHPADKSQIETIREKYRKACENYKIASPKIERSFLPVIKDKNLKNSASVVNIRGDSGLLGEEKKPAELPPQPKINQLTAVKEIYWKELSKIKRLIHSQFP
eukprot:TRINITY_DN25601_c0_g1_i2.p1 TRINITY_DN25601_c0_g1~~TRINITY_DN25601_c0_g1_i2.p1  ORF type:complete len:406 (+),score=59.56 TRINITY_DN25601_c0_g1_i2:123-1340(+)